MGERSELVRAAVLGAGGGLRSFAPPAVLAARGRGPFPGPARFIAWGAAIGELIADAQPQMGSRWARRGLSLRIAFSATAGRELAGPPGAAVAVSAAVLTARAGSRMRARLDGGRVALVAAGAEDLLAYGLVAWATA